MVKIEQQSTGMECHLLKNALLPITCSACLILFPNNCASLESSSDLTDARQIAESCAAQVGRTLAARRDGRVIRLPNAVCFVGPIRPHTVEKLLAVDLPRDGWLYVNSDGGNVSLALDVADRIIDNNVSIIVDGFCASSCANYWFPAASKKVVLENSYVAFHGVPRTRSNPGWSESDYENYLSMVKRSDMFYQRVNVDQRMAAAPPRGWLGNGNENQRSFWTWSQKELDEQFGVKGIIYYWGKR